jgi:hypothetical protein
LPKQYLEKLLDLILKKSLKANAKTIAIDCNDSAKGNWFEF